jgi:phosphoglycerate dehydrogenase-like enzyme
MQKISSPVIAEHAIALLLALTRNLPEFIDGSQQGAWQRDEKHTTGMTTIEGKTMLVLGLGGIGSEIARRAAALGMRVVATRNSSRKGPEFVDYVGLSNETLDLARNADVIVNSLPLTPATRGLLDSDFFAAGSARRPYFINVGRGGTVDTARGLASTSPIRSRCRPSTPSGSRKMSLSHHIYRQRVTTIHVKCCLRPRTSGDTWRALHC